MTRTLAESIRQSLSVLSEAPGNLQYALSDLHKEGNGQPSPELADEIAADYDLKGSDLLAAYPSYVEKMKNAGSASASMDPDKAREKSKYDAKNASKARDAEWAAERQADQEAQSALRDRHTPELERVRADIEDLVAPPGWSLEVKDPEHSNPLSVSDLIYTNQAGDIRIIMHVWLENKEAARGKAPAPTVPYTVHGDTTFKAGDTWYTFTAYDKHGDSFSIGQYSGEAQSFADIPTVIAQQAARAQKSIDAKS